MCSFQKKNLIKLQKLLKRLQFFLFGLILITGQSLDAAYQIF